MTPFDPEYFRPFKPTKEEIQGYLRNAERNLSIARQDSFVEVRTCFCRDYFCSLGKGSSGRMLAFPFLRFACPLT